MNEKAAPSPFKRAHRKIRHGIRLARFMLFHNRFPNAATTRAYAAYLNEKRVALVGPAPTIENSHQRDHIESHDVVVRINHSIPVPDSMRDDVGERTDVLYHNLWREHPRARPFPELADLLETQVQWICSAKPYLNTKNRKSPEIDAFADVLADRVPFHVPATWPCIRLQWKLGTELNAGISAILDLLRFDITRLYITGFTFYSGPRDYYEGYVGSGFTGHHAQDPQRKYIARRLARDPRVELDTALRNILHPPADVESTPAAQGDET